MAVVKAEGVLRCWQWEGFWPLGVVDEDKDEIKIFLICFRQNFSKS